MLILEDIYKQITQLTDFKPQVGVVLGSGLGNFREAIDLVQEIPYSDIKGFPASTVEGHSGRFLLGNLGTLPLVLMDGRIHYYEGYSMDQVTLPIRLMGLWGIKALLLSNAAGGVNKSFKPGDFMQITDHISALVPSPLVGPNNAQLGPRFPDMSYVYHPALNKIIKEVALKEKIPLQQGVYAQFTGPQYETPAEIRMIEILGGDAVGMSTACEAIVANHMGIPVAGISCITNMAAGLSVAALDHEDVQATAQKVTKEFQTLVYGSLIKIQESFL